MSTSSSTTKVPKRGARACLTCRRLKKTCDGNEPCSRCERNGTSDTCIFDKPPPPLVEDPKGLERLVAMEELMTQLVENIALINKNVTQILINQQAQSVGSPSPEPDPLASLFSQLPAAGPSDSTFNLNLDAPTIPLIPIPTSSSTLIQTTSFIPRQEHTLPPSIDTEADSFLLPSHISPPTALDPPEAKSFETSLDTPIEALARAAQAASQYLPDDQSRLAEESQLAEPATVVERDGSSDDTRPRKRTRIAFLPTKTSSVEQLDVVSKGIVADQQAREWVNLFMVKCQPYCTILNPAFDTYESLRRSSHILFNTLVYLSARTEGGASPPSPTLVAVAAEIRAHTQSLIFETQPPIETIQALILMAVWHDEPYMLSGIALRMAAATRLEKTFDHFDAHGWEKTDPKAHQLITRVRVWIYLCYLDFKHSASTGRLILISPSDIETVEKNTDKIFLSPLSTKDDNRMVANLKLTILHRKVLLSTPPTLQSSDPSALVEYHQTLQTVLQKWFDSYDAALAVEYPADFHFPRRSHLRQLCDGKLLLAGLVFKTSLLDRSPHPAIVEIAHDAFQFARASMHTVLQSTAYVSNLQYSGYLTRVDLSFAGFMALKLAALYPELVEPHEIVGEVLRVADLISNCSGSQKYCMSLKIAADNFLAKKGPSRGESGPFTDPLSALQELSSTQQASTSNALLPGEVEIDWTSLASSFVDTSDLLTGDWVPYSSFSADNDTWFDDFALGGTSSSS